MTRSTPIPNHGAVLAAIETLHNSAAQHRRLRVLAVARYLNMSNTTLRRHYPDIATDIANSAPNTQTSTGKTGAATTQLRDTARLRAENRALREHLELAIASIQRLTIQNDPLRQELPPPPSTSVRPLRG